VATGGLGASACHGEALRRRKSDASGRELFSGIHFGMDDWGIWRLKIYACFAGQFLIFTECSGKIM
jgi:hypothetical protein